MPTAVGRTPNARLRDLVGRRILDPTENKVRVNRNEPTPVPACSSHSAAVVPQPHMVRHLASPPPIVYPRRVSLNEPSTHSLPRPRASCGVLPARALRPLLCHRQPIACVLVPLPSS